jgi:hypothetical protein
MEIMKARGQPWSRGLPGRPWAVSGVGGSGAGDVADGVELVRGEAEEIVFGKATVAEQAGEDMRQDGVAVVEVAVDAAALLAEPGFQFPQVRGFRDPRGAFLGFTDGAFEFPAECQVEGSAGDGLLRRGPLPIAWRLRPGGRLPGCVRRSYSLLPWRHFSSGRAQPGHQRVSRWRDSNPPFRVPAVVPRAALPTAAAVRCDTSSPAGC